MVRRSDQSDTFLLFTQFRNSEINLNQRYKFQIQLNVTACVTGGKATSWQEAKNFDDNETIVLDVFA